MKCRQRFPAPLVWARVFQLFVIVPAYEYVHANAPGLVSQAWAMLSAMTSDHIKFLGNGIAATARLLSQPLCEGADA